jgi:DNA-binding response OmpR family regulator
MGVVLMVATTAGSFSDSMTTTARTVLIVEDEEHIRTCVAEFLCDDGYRVLQAGDVAEAKDLLQCRHVDLVFSDVNMPNSETGFALERWVRLHYPGAKVLLTSGYPQNARDTAGLMEPILMKPYRCAALLSRINQVLCNVKA